MHTIVVYPPLSCGAELRCPAPVPGGQPPLRGERVPCTNLQLCARPLVHVRVDCARRTQALTAIVANIKYDRLPTYFTICITYY
jgi:hypothetical protein